MKYANGLKLMPKKIVCAPLTINELSNDIISNDVYFIDYNNSQIKNKDLINYIRDTGINADIILENIDINDKINIINYYMNFNNFIHIPSINKCILEYIYFIKNKNIINKLSLLEIDFIKNNISLFNKWISFYDSYFIYMIYYLYNKNNIIDNYDSDKIINDNSISPNVVSLLLDDFFYDYFKTHIDTNNIYYWKYYYNSKYDSKSFNEIMLNNNNFIIKILKDLQNPLFNQFIMKTISNN